MATKFTFQEQQTTATDVDGVPSNYKHLGYWNYINFIPNIMHVFFMFFSIRCQFYDCSL